MRNWIAAFVCVAALAAISCTTTPPPRGARLYMLDCGTIAPMDPTLFGVKKEESRVRELRDALLPRRASRRAR